jgi:hypothetical protein
MNFCIYHSVASTVYGFISICIIRKITLKGLQKHIADRENFIAVRDHQMSLIVLISLPKA